MSLTQTYLLQNQANHLAKLQQYLQQPSISATGLGINECAQLLANYYHTLGCQEVEIIPTPGHPAVWAYYDAGAPTTIAVYGMYDVQPVANQPWTHDPFSAALVPQHPFPQVVIARGAYNSKGTYRLFLNALETIIAAHGQLPVNIMFLSEGEEEIGSPHFPQVVAQYHDRLQQASLLLDIEASQNKEGNIIVKLGNKGVVYAELIADAATAGYGPQHTPLHSSHKSIVDSPALRLIQALSTLTTPDGNHVTIPGFYDDVCPPSAADHALFTEFAPNFDPKIYADLWNVPRWSHNLTGHDWLNQYLFQPSLNINNLIAGDTSGATLTIIPHQARAAIDIRLVPNMNPTTVINQLRYHLDHHGFTDITINTRVAYDWNKTDPQAPAVTALRHVYDQYGYPYEILPFSAGSQPLYLFNKPPLNLPMIRFSLGHGARNHAADEYLVIDGAGHVADMLTIEQAFIDLLFQLSQLT
ncbi:MAG TPA: M20/M25/M40 family metallo-hydrolase [Anaerolineae bacterium]|nr:M20/M25/M40 family metallo-hydrolase [Anaerolineae bacterium]